MIPVTSRPCESTREEADAGGHDPGFGAGEGCFEILGETPVAAEPSKGALDHPAAWLSSEGSDRLGSGNDLNRPFAEVSNSIEQFVAAIDAIGEDVAQLGEASAERSQQRHCAVIVLNVGSVHDQSEQRSFRISDNVALAPLDPLERVKPARPATFRAFHALAIDDASGRKRPSSDCLTNPADESVVDPVPGTVVAPTVEISLNSGARRKVLWQSAPLATCRKDVENRIQHGSQIDGPRSAE